jgi:hypothetical protein
MATVTAGYTWTSGETVTPAKLNSAAAPTVAVANDEITTAKILDANVTNAKLASDIDASKLTTGTLPIARIADAAVIPAKLSQPLTLATAKAYNWNGSSSNKVLDFESIPSWAKRITVMLNGVSTNGTSIVQIQLGASSFSTSGYKSNASYGSTSAVQYATATSGFIIDPSGQAAAVTSRSGAYTFVLIGSNVWVGSGAIADSAIVATTSCAGNSPALSGTLDRIRLTTVNGDDTFDAGSVNIMYEG